MGRKNRDKIRRNQMKKTKKQELYKSEKVGENIGKIVEVTSKQSTTIKRTYKPCHSGFYEIYPHLYVGKESDLNREILEKIDVLIPLNDLNGRIWNRGFRGDIMYVPIQDFSTLPIDVEKKYVEKIVSLIREGKNVAIFCLGGHGRTGYIASLVLSEFGFKNPIHHIRTKYCDRAIESYDQLEAIAMYCDNEDLMPLYEKSVYGGGSLYDDLWGKYSKSSVSMYTPSPTVYTPSTTAIKTPYTNSYFNDEWYENNKSETEKAEYLKKIESIFANVEDEDDDIDTKAYKDLLKEETCGGCVEERNGFCCFYQVEVKRNAQACLEFSNKI